MTLKENKKQVVVFIYNSFNDPLFKGLLYKYITRISKSGMYQFHIITFEQEKYLISDDDKEGIKKRLAENNINWIPLQFHTGRLLLLKKSYDFLQAMFQIVRIQFKYRPRAILAFANIAGSFSYLLSLIFRWKVIVFSYEPHSQFLEELGFWKKKSLKYKLLNNIEKRLGTRGDHIITGTQYMIDQLQEWGAKSKTYRLPTSVDQTVFQFSKEARVRIRKDLAINDRKVVIYTGKFGDLYYKEEIFELCSTLYQQDETYFFVFLTGHDRNELKELFEKYKIPFGAFHIDRVPMEEVPHFLSASDMGLVTVANFPSKKFCSPTKVGEYLCCGIPYIVTIGTSEDDLYADKYNVGVVVDSFQKADVMKKFQHIESLMSESKDTLRARCRDVGVEYRGMGQAVDTISGILEIV
ncbi:glycosyltransferase [Reichenbachiella versicolor]|uniref:glycosyltransferase n=1 Tax=Reichenbachiella versicolor TaxID=1821036 RepID=UPI000D6E9B56|nr:glycosyltransferase [Reichenbachiella versicolor]